MPEPTADNPLATQLAEARTALASLQQEREIDAALLPHRPIDLAAARAALLQQLQPGQSAGHSAGKSPADAAAALRSQQPHLFEPPTRPASASGARTASSPAAALESAAAGALATGHRADLLAYLRLKRKTKTST